MAIKHTSDKSTGWTGRLHGSSGTLNHCYANSDIHNNYSLYFITSACKKCLSNILSLHSTAITKLASQENRQGHVNGAGYYFFIGSATLDSFSVCRCRLFKR
jgi:hypothetical protein